MNRVRIFISSPGDVAEERSRAQAVVERLAVEFADELQLETLLWEHEPLLASADFQSQIRSPADFDIFATVIGSRLGSPLGDQFKRADGTPYASGTEFEFEVALDSFRAKGTPELLVYRKRPPAEPIDPQQMDLVDRFFARWFMDSTTHTATGAYHWFEQPQQFEDVFALHLRKLLRRFLPRPNNIPVPISNFVGRSDLLNKIKSQLSATNTRLLTLVGAGGTGKSRIALRVAREMLPDFDDGVFFVPLANLTDAALIPGAIATALSIRQHEGQTMLDSLSESLRHKELLLVLDNLEQIRGAGTLLNTLLGSCPELKVLATSRANLKITGASHINVPPLQVTARAANSLAEAQQTDAVALFVDRARIAQPEFELQQSNYREVVDICRALDGLPLAIELATSRLRSMNTTRLLKAMDKRFAVLKGGADDLLDHQKSLRELVMWSYDLLSEEEQMLWRRMAVFAGSFSVAAAEQVCDPEDEFIVDVEVEGLADHSLASITIGEEPRVQMLGTLREFALNKLDEVGELATFQQRLVDWACELSAQAHHDFAYGSTDATLNRMDLEYDNLLAAINYCRANQDPRALQVASGVWYHWFERGYMGLARQLLEPALTDDSLPPTTRAHALKGLGSITRFQKDLDTATQCCELAFDLYEQNDDVDGQANALGELGAIAISSNKLEDAASQLDRAINIRETAHPNDHHLSFLLATRGVVYHLNQALDQAKSYYSRALEIGAQLGDMDSKASAMVNMGEIAEAEADVSVAYSYYRDSLQLFYERGKKVAIAYCAEVLAGLSARHLSQAAHAALLFGFTDSLRTEINTPIEPFNEQRLRDDIEFTRSVLSESEFKNQWEIGAGLHLEDFLSYIQQGELSQQAELSANTQH